ncbi:MAG: hypothetical protein F4X59_02780 [Holophagales bacterium]|nr:hypothetical protein [Holophagales bacterium]MYC09036.1 hypothetical protein [Holophagales bacterium]
MGSMITLSVGRLEIDWGKNMFFRDHSQLFQPSDLAPVPYYYVDENDPYTDEEGHYNLVTVMKDGLSKPLDEVMERVGLLGYTMKVARREFEHLSRLNDLDTSRFSFDQLVHALATVNVRSLSPDYGEGEDFGRFFRRYLFERIGLDKIVDDPARVEFMWGESMENLSAYAILQAVAQNPSALGLPVTWQFADLEEGGWAKREDFLGDVHKENQFLIVTEGSSDAQVLRHALSLLKPHVADFFYFVDMSEGYPFTGTGNLHNFAKGLVGIAVRNNVIILYDNDAEGVAGFNRTVGLSLPSNMRVLRLPDLEEFRDFRTIGPSGVELADINGRAAAIECYLDVGSDAVVRWKNYKRELDVYHGELVEKRDVMRSFLAEGDVRGDCDFSKIAVVIDMIVSECSAMREVARLAEVAPF